MSISKHLQTELDAMTTGTRKKVGKIRYSDIMHDMNARVGVRLVRVGVLIACAVKTAQATVGISDAGNVLLFSLTEAGAGCVAGSRVALEALQAGLIRRRIAAQAPRARRGRRVVADADRRVA